MLPNADVLYACDGKWWNGDDGREALEQFRGLKITQDAKAAETYGLHRVIHSDGVHRILTDRPGIIGAGGNGGFHALNLAVQFGARRIILLGYDMHDCGGIHWHGRHKNGIGDPHPGTLKTWIKYFEDNAELLARLGVDIINCSPGTALTCFQKQDLRDVATTFATAS